MAIGAASSGQEGSGRTPASRLEQSQGLVGLVGSGTLGGELFGKRRGWMMSLGSL